MFSGWGNLFANGLAKYWYVVVLSWVIFAAVLRWSAPAWDSVTQDGDLQFLPDKMTSRTGQRLLSEAFPNYRSRSRLVIVFARDEDRLSASDLAFGLDVGRRLLHLAAIAEFQAWQKSATESDKQLVANYATTARTADDSEESVADEFRKLPYGLRHAIKLLDQSIELDEIRFETISVIANAPADLLDDRLAIAYFDRAALLNVIGEADRARADAETAELLDETIVRSTSIADRDIGAWQYLINVWTWKDDLLAAKLGDDSATARMIMLQLASEFIAASNIQLMEQIEQLIDGSKERHSGLSIGALQIGVSGSAVVGGDMLKAARNSVQQTELVTIVLILVILALIYRSVILVFIPLMTIGLSLHVAVSVISLMAIPPESVSRWFGFQVFTTTRIFLVVLLFGAGTDFCLFFIARCRENFFAFARANVRLDRLPTSSRDQLVANSWSGVLLALLGSALTTIVGLSLMYFSDFGKFSNTGPIIAVSLAVTITVCLTFTPALVAGIGTRAIWARAKRSRNVLGQSSKETSHKSNIKDARPTLANRFSGWLVRMPIAVLTICLMLLGVPAAYGWLRRGDVTYDFANELSYDAPSRVGTRMVEQHFTVRDATPLIAVVSPPRQFADDKTFRLAVDELRQKLYIEGVAAVRCITDPLGDFPPERRMGLFDQEAWRRRLLENHALTQQVYSSSSEQFNNSIARLDLLIDENPFSSKAEFSLQRVQERLDREVNSTDSPWYGSTFAVTGTTAGIHDLKTVTQSDQARIQIIVTLGVLFVLMVLLRRISVSVCLVATVLLSYMTTLGITHCFFAWAYPASFDGLDWKVPLFLFVILIAVGQDYNVYLTTRILEEQKKLGPIRGLQKAMESTGGIITQCGIVMAGTFISMTAGALLNWLSNQGINLPLIGSFDTPTLRGVVELGFALAVGVLIDTFVVRSVLVPAIFAMLTRLGRLSSRGHRV